MLIAAPTAWSGPASETCRRSLRHLGRHCPQEEMQEMSPCLSQQFLLLPGQQSVLVPALCHFAQRQQELLPEQLEPSGPRAAGPGPRRGGGAAAGPGAAAAEQGWGPASAVRRFRWPGRSLPVPRACSVPGMSLPRRQWLSACPLLGYFFSQYLEVNGSVFSRTVVFELAFVVPGASMAISIGRRQVLCRSRDCGVPSELQEGAKCWASVMCRSGKCITAWGRVQQVADCQHPPPGPPPRAPEFLLPSRRKATAGIFPQRKTPRLILG